MVDLTACGEVAGRSVGSLSDSVIAGVTALYSAWVAGKAPAEDFAALGTYAALAANDVVIDPDRHLSLPTVTVRDRSVADELYLALSDRLDDLAVMLIGAL